MHQQPLHRPYSGSPHVSPLAPIMLAQRVVRFVDVELRPSRFLYMLLSCLTLGLYAVFIKVCPCCCWRRIDVDRGRLIVTSAGRVGLWRSVQAGLKKGSNLKLQSNVSIDWYSVKNLTSIHVSRAFKLGLCGSKLLGENESVSLRMFFGSYPR